MKTFKKMKNENFSNKFGENTWKTYYMPKCLAFIKKQVRQVSILLVLFMQYKLVTNFNKTTHLLMQRSTLSMYFPDLQ